MNNKIVEEIKRRSLLFAVDNPKFIGHRIALETIMMIGASIVLEQQAKEEREEVLDSPLSAEQRVIMKRLFSQPIFTSEQQEGLIR
jgi:hypothetical protein